MKFLKKTKVSLATGALALVTQSLLILTTVPSIEVEGQNVLTVNSQAVIDMAIN